MGHIPLALGIQVCIAAMAVLLGFSVEAGLLAGGCAGAWKCIGREYAQAEYRLINGWYGGKRANMPTLAPLREARAWNSKSMLDWIAPAVAVSVVTLMFH